ncbi:sugar porter family MFS transporter [Candidatus Latescibacterota bacterium]
MANGIESGNSVTSSADNGSIMYAYFISFVAAVGGLLFGFDTGVISGAIPFIIDHFSLNSHQAGFAVSNLMIACTVGATFSGPLTDRFGRKKILILAAFLFVASAVMSAFPRTFSELIVARFIGGLAVGVASVISPMYIAEISPAHIRGRLVALNQLAIVTGILMSGVSNWLLVDIGANNWRWMFAAEAMPAGLFLIALFYIPDSPRWLLKQGISDAAYKVLARVGGSAHAEIEMRQIKENLDQEEGTLHELFRPGLRKVLLVGVLLALFAHITGIDTIIYYGPIIFMKAGYQSASSALLATVAIGITNLVFTIVGISMVDKFGRKNLLLTGMAIMTVAITLVGYTFQSETINPILIIVPTLVFCASFTMSMGVVIWVYLSEIYPTKIRGRAVSIATMVLWLSNVVIAQVFPWIMEKIAGNTFYVFSGICVIAFIFIWTMITETKGKTLEEIEKMWGGERQL